MRRAMAAAVLVVALAACSSSSGSDGSRRSALNASSSLDAAGVQKRIQGAGIKCPGKVKPYKPEADAAEGPGVAPEMELTCRTRTGSITISEWKSANARGATMKAGADLACQYGLVRFTYIAAGRWALSAQNSKTDDFDVEVTEKLGEAVRVTPTVVDCPEG